MIPGQRSGAVWKSRGPWLAGPNSPYGLCGRKATLNVMYVHPWHKPIYLHLSGGRSDIVGFICFPVRILWMYAFPLMRRIQFLCLLMFGCMPCHETSFDLCVSHGKGDISFGIFVSPARHFSDVCAFPWDHYLRVIQKLCVPKAKVEYLLAYRCFSKSTVRYILVHVFVGLVNL